MTEPASLPDPQALGETFHLAWDLAVGGQVLNADHPLVVIQDCWDALVALADGAAQLEAERGKWLAWSDGAYPDTSPGDVIWAEPDGTIVLDDAVTTWDPLRALAFIDNRRQGLLDDWVLLSEAVAREEGKAVAAEERVAALEAELRDERQAVEVAKSWIADSDSLQARVAALEAERDKIQEGRDIDRRILEGFRDRAEERAAKLETALTELEAAVTPKLATMNYHFGPQSRAAVGRESEDSWRRIKAACEDARAALGEAT